MADMIDGVIVANRLTGHDAGRVKDLLWAAVAGLLAPLTHEEENVDLAPVRPIRAA